MVHALSGGSMSPASLFNLLVWKVDLMTRIPAAILGHGVTLGREARGRDRKNQ